MTIADDIVELLKRKHHLPGLTGRDIAELLFGQEHGSQSRVTAALQKLVKEKRLERKGNRWSYTYHLPPFPRRRLG
jgi:hypothetical protein